MNQYSYLAAEGSSLPNGTTVNPYNLDVSTTSATPVVFNVKGWQVACVGAQFSKGASAAVLAVKYSIDGKTPHDLETAQTLTPTDATTDTIDVNGIAYLHVYPSTAESSVTAAVFCYAEAN